MHKSSRPSQILLQEADSPSASLFWQSPHASAGKLWCSVSARSQSQPTSTVRHGMPAHVHFHTAMWQVACRLQAPHLFLVLRHWYQFGAQIDDKYAGAKETSGLPLITADHSIATMLTLTDAQRTDRPHTLLCDADLKKLPSTARHRSASRHTSFTKSASFAKTGSSQSSPKGSGARSALSSAPSRQHSGERAAAAATLKQTAGPPSRLSLAPGGASQKQPGSPLSRRSSLAPGMDGAAGPRRQKGRAAVQTGLLGMAAVPEDAASAEVRLPC